ncbi:MAG: hypothetical protein V4619_09540 [Bacteroidota bacterium]
MQKTILLKRCLLLTTAFVLLFTGSCKKGSNNGTDTPAPTTKQITLDKTSALPGDLVILTSTTSLDKDTWQIKIGSKTATVVKSADKIAYFSVPYIPAGTQTVDLSSMGITAAKSITINAYTPIANPQVEVNKFKAQLDTAKALANKPQLASYKSALNDFEKAFEESYAALNDEEKKELAFIMSRQAAAEAEAELKLANTSPTFNTNALKTFDAGDLIVDKGRSYAFTVKKCIASGVVSIALLMLPEPTFVSKAAAAISGTYSIVKLLKALDLIDEITNMIGIEFSVDQLNNITKQQNVDKVKVNSLNPYATNASFTFSKSLPAASCQVMATYASISVSQKTNLAGQLAAIFTDTDNLQDIYNRFKTSVAFAKKYIPKLPEMSAFVYPIPTAPKQTNLQIAPAANFSIENVSNNKIKVAITSSGEKITLRTTTTDSIKTNIDFTFDLVYKNAKFGTTLRKTITANYNGAPPSVIGTWMATTEYEQQLENGVVKREYNDTYRPNELVVVISATQLKFYESGVLESTVNYTLAGDKITYVENGKNNTRTIKSITDTQMVLTYDDPKSANGINYNEHIETTFVRQP